MSKNSKQSKGATIRDNTKANMRLPTPTPRQNIPKIKKQNTQQKNDNGN